MKRIIVLTLSVVLLLVLTGCTKTPGTSGGKFDAPYDSLKSVIESAPIIIKGTVSGPPEKLVYDDIDFIITTIKVEEILRGKEIAKGSEIRILQTDIDYKADLEADSSMVLMVEAYEGPVAKDVYTMPNGEQDKLKLKGNVLTSDFDKDSKFGKDVINNNKYEDLIKLIEATPYKESKTN